MSYSFNTLKRQISKAAEGDERYNLMDLDRKVYRKYQDGKLTDREYQDLCALMEYLS